MGPVPTMALSQMLWAVGGGVGSAYDTVSAPALSPHLRQQEAQTSSSGSAQIP